MPHYRFVVTGEHLEDQRAEEFGLFNDQGALQFARRFSHSGEVEVWQQERLVGRVEPSRPRTPVSA